MLRMAITLEKDDRLILRQSGFDTSLKHFTALPTLKIMIQLNSQSVDDNIHIYIM